MNGSSESDKRAQVAMSSYPVHSAKSNDMAGLESELSLMENNIKFVSGEHNMNIEIAGLLYLNTLQLRLLRPLPHHLYRSGSTSLLRRLHFRFGLI